MKIHGTRQIIAQTISSLGTIIEGVWNGTPLVDAYIASAAAWNAKQAALSLTTTGNSGAATLISNTLNIPQYLYTSVPTMKWSTIFETESPRWNSGLSASASKGFNNDGMYLHTGGPANGWAYYQCNMTEAEANFDPMVGNPIWSCTPRISPGTANDFQFQMGLGDVAPYDLLTTWLNKHVGFKASRVAGGTLTLKGSQANGTTEVLTASLATIVDGDWFDLILQINGSSSVDYYVRQNNGAKSAAVNLTGSMPSGTQGRMGFGVNNMASSVETVLEVSCTSYER